MSEMNFRAINNDNGAVEVYTTADGAWSTAAIVGALEGFGLALGHVVESAAKDLKEERQHEFVMDCCVALNKKLMALSEKY